MAQGFKDHFSGVAGAYQAFRPGYPPALFDWLAGAAPRRDLAVDLGCGNGQASVGLAGRFQAVIGIDPSAEQVAHAERRAGVSYRAAPAEATGLADACADLVIAAQAFHWFDPAPFARELARICRPGAVFAAFTYGRSSVAPEIDAHVDRLYTDIVGPYWPPERAHVESGYRTLPFPWPELAAPTFVLEERWDLDRLLGYLGTWSSVSRYRKVRGEDPLVLVLDDLAAAWGPRDRIRTVTWPLTLRAGRVGASPDPELR
ncbi:class I SAM-dependent methyltransferase [Anaeromyxobacter oryzae]|uniref:SAM-dependent methyltransferase n=1 Tax=Anaeromyxobacter oryzae TaxID=2918170 RepID=A0ABM7WNU6_9BACT|nr:class I SAM-dependent methyltransferase [Anaeromyxobacter oryzae]BDG01141.1 SAM-dependent methyltransferase [Anaeromyxobacter oryzae]